MRNQKLLPSLNLQFGELRQHPEDSTLMHFYPSEMSVDAMREWVTAYDENDLIRSVPVLANRVYSTVLIRVSADTGQTYALGAIEAIEKLVDVSC